MSLIKCPKCGEMFSDSYKTCPFCEEDEAYYGGRVKKTRGRRTAENRKRRAPSILGPVVVIVLGLLVLLVYLLATLLPNALCDVRQVELRVDGNAVILPAMLDSGNLLRDPLTGLPVLVVPRKAARLLFPGVYDLGDLASLPLGFRLLNVRTAAGSALLPLFRPDECRLYLNGHPSEARLLVAVAGPEYGGAQALVPMAALSASFS